MTELLRALLCLALVLMASLLIYLAEPSCEAHPECAARIVGGGNAAP